MKLVDKIVDLFGHYAMAFHDVRKQTNVTDVWAVEDEALADDVRKLLAEHEADEITRLTAENERLTADHAFARQNFHTMQNAANELRIRAEKAEAENERLKAALAKIGTMPSRRPCDCDRCDCRNVGDAQSVAAWDAEDAVRAEARAALEQP